MINAEGPPVPIPNTEVKLCRAEDTWLATARENRYAPTLRQRLDFSLAFRHIFLHSSVGSADEALSKAQKRETQTNLAHQNCAGFHIPP